jgi:hypothetical protein
MPETLTHLKEEVAARTRGHSRGWLIGILIVLVVLIAARIALPYVLRSAINRRLNNIPDYGGHVTSVSVSLYRGAYHLSGLEIMKRNGQVQEPFFSGKDIDFSLAWRELFHGRVVSDIYLDQPKLNFIKGPTAETSQLAADRRWQDVITDIFPIDINYLKITDGTLRYVNHASNPQVDIRVEHTLAVATGLRNRAGANQDELPADISLRGVTIGNGKLHIDSQVEPLAAQPHFLLRIELEDVSLPALNEFLRAYGNVDVSAGVFKGYLEMTAHNGRYSGYFKPLFQHVDFSAVPGESRPLGREIWEVLVHGFAVIFRNHHKEQVATRIPFSGEFGNMDVGVWQTFVNLARNGFIQALPEKLDSKSTPKETSEATPADKATPANAPQAASQPKN